MERITSRKNPLLEHMRRLDSAAFRRQQGEFLCDSPKLVGEALRHGARVLAVAVSDGVEPPEGLDASVRCAAVPPDVMASISPMRTPQGMLAVCRLPDTALPEMLPGSRYVVLDGVQGRGQYIGTYLALTTLERYWWGEGEMKFYLDGDLEYPTICGTGTEDYFGGAWSFASQEDGKTVENTYCTPFLGYPYYSHHDDSVHNDYHNDDCPPMRGFYRWHIMDPIHFEEDLKVTLQQIGVCHRGLFERQDDVATVAYWYQAEPHGAFPPLPDREYRWPR